MGRAADISTKRLISLVPENWVKKEKGFESYTNSINDCNTSLGKDAMNRVSTNDLFVAFFFQIHITRQHY
ncbi:hypothetical protein [Nostoc sp.]|uniref:hypothetical protein n=1 Tax=Nostoc sp. TaxID=1180 RepID=UPI002FF71126